MAPGDTKSNNARRPLTMATIAKRVSKMLTETLDTVNNGLVNYKKISTLIVVKDEWTQENGIVGPTQKLKRGAVEDLYSGSYLKWHESNEKLIFE